MADNSGATGAYRAQNGIPQTGSYDPTVVDWIVKAAAATGADPTVLAATGLQETGLERGRVGDNGTSYGPFQHHEGGALANHDAAWANSYAAVLDRAQQFARYSVHHGKGAAAVQRPADRELYAKGVDGLMAEAAAILKERGVHPTDAGKQAARDVQKVMDAVPSTSTRSDEANIGSLMQGFIDSNARAVGLPGAPQLGTPESGDALQRLLDANGRLAGLPAPHIASLEPPKRKQAPAPSSPGATTPPTSKPGPVGRITTINNPSIIGRPYQGTHRLGNWESDNAVDIALPARTPIYAAAAGTIGPQIGSLHSSDPHMAGLRLHLQIKGNELYYQHLQTIVVHAGQHVKAGQLLGYSGALNHVHLGAKNGDPGRFA